MSENVQLAQVLTATFGSLMENVHTCLPGQIDTYDFKTQKATVKPLIKKVYNDGDVLELPILTNVPIVFPRTKTSGITFPINRGDGVLLLFSERALERWYSTGKDSEPGDPRRFDLSDAIAVPGLFSFNQSNLASNNDDLQIHNDGQTITIKKSGDVEIGGSGLKALVTESFLTAFDAHTHTVPIVGPVGVTPSTPPLIPQSPITTNVTQKVKAQ